MTPPSAQITTEDLERKLHGPLEGAVCGTPPEGESPGRWADMWHPDTYRFMAGPRKGQRNDATEIAIALCNMCVIKDECGSRALAVEGDAPAEARFGIYGGMDPEDRYDRMVELNDGKDLPKRRFSQPSEEAAPVRRKLIDALIPGENPSALDARVADAVGLSPDTVQAIRTGARPRVRTTTAAAIMAYFDRTPRPI